MGRYHDAPYDAMGTRLKVGDPVVSVRTSARPGQRGTYRGKVRGESELVKVLWDWDVAGDWVEHVYNDTILKADFKTS